MPSIAYPNQHFDIKYRMVIVPDTVKISFTLNIESTDKISSIVNNVGRALVKKKMLMLRSKEIDIINKAYLCPL